MACPAHLVPQRQPRAVPVIARVSPAAAYYTLSIGGRTVGFASLTLDTTLTTVDVTEQVDLRLPDADTVLRIVQRSRTTLDRSLGFLGTVVSRIQSGERTEIRATAVGDSAVAWQAGPEGRPGQGGHRRRGARQCRATFGAAAAAGGPAHPGEGDASKAPDRGPAPPHAGPGRHGGAGGLDADRGRQRGHEPVHLAMGARAIRYAARLAGEPSRRWSSRDSLGGRGWFAGERRAPARPSRRATAVRDRDQCVSAAVRRRRTR